VSEDRETEAGARAVASRLPRGLGALVRCSEWLWGKTARPTDSRVQRVARGLARAGVALALAVAAVAVGGVLALVTRPAPEMGSAVMFAVWKRVAYVKTPGPAIIAVGTPAPDGTLTVPVQVCAGARCVKVTAMLDTGASTSCVAGDVARWLGLRLRPGPWVDGVGGPTRMEEADATLTLRTPSGRVLAVMPSPVQVAPAFPTPPDVDLGADLLDAAGVTLTLAGNYWTLTVARPPVRLDSAGADPSVPVWWWGPSTWCTAASRHPTAVVPWACQGP